VLAAERLGIVDLPVVVARGWSDQNKRAYRLTDNELALHAHWEQDAIIVPPAGP
jgi:hypothetical protein